MRTFYRVKLPFGTYYITSEDPSIAIRYILNTFEKDLLSLTVVRDIPRRALVYDVDRQEFVDEVVL